jgi:GTP pyrophosphokinase
MHPEREIEVNWSGELDAGFAADIVLKAHDRTGILKEITTVLGNDKVPVLGMQTASDVTHNTCEIQLKVEVKDVHRLSLLLTRLRKIRSVIDVYKINS